MKKPSSRRNDRPGAEGAGGHDRRNLAAPQAMSPQSGNQLHGITLEMILDQLVARYGWEALGRKIKIRCFIAEPSIKSSLMFLRKTPWARKEVEELYLRSR